MIIVFFPEFANFTYYENIFLNQNICNYLAFSFIFYYFLSFSACVIFYQTVAVFFIGKFYAFIQIFSVLRRKKGKIQGYTFDKRFVIARDFVHFECIVLVLQKIICGILSRTFIFVNTALILFRLKE